MTIRVPNNVLMFAGEANLAVYKMFADYFNHYRSMNGAKNVEYQKTTVTPEGQTVELSFSEKEDKMNAALKKEIMRVAGINDISQFPVETWASHPMLRWSTFATVSNLIDMILPQTIIDSIGIYSDVRSIGWGDNASFDVSPRDLFAVSKAGRSKRIAEMRKQFKGQVIINTEPREITVMVSMMKVLSGKESLADYAMRAVRSIETQVALDVYTLFASTMAAIDNSADGLRVAGFTQSEFTRLAQTVAAWNGGAKPIAIGTQRALGNILPAD